MKVVKQTASFVTSYASPPSIVSTPDSNGSSDSSFTGIPVESLSEDEPSFISQDSPFASAANLHSNPKTIYNQADADCSFSATVCGFCGQETNCFCGEMTLHEPALEGTQVSLKMGDFEHDNATRHSMHPTASSKIVTRTSILEKLPAYQAPIPLRQRVVASNFNSVFPVSTPTPKYSTATVTCSGDPTNCLACADDSFGQAFCAAIGDSVAATPPCNDCPCRSNGSNSNDRDEGLAKCALHRHDASPQCSGHTSGGQPASGTIPTNDAWQQIKSHPNVAFADLSLLADVVARRSKCTGPRVVISPALGAITPERVDSPPAYNSQAPPDDQSILLTNPHTRYHSTQVNGSPPKLVHQELLAECGRQRVREVRAEAVREALHLLDVKFSQS